MSKTVKELELPQKWFYESLAKDTPVAGLKKILLGLALDEQKHCDIVKKLKAGVVSTMAETTVLDKAKTVLQKLIAKRSAVDSLYAFSAGCELAMQCEAENFCVYKHMANIAKNPNVAELLQQIAEEERKHFNIMDNLHGFAADPQNFSAWIEFTDFKGYDENPTSGS